MTDPFRERCKDCPHLQEAERERDSLKAELKKIVAIVENRNDLFDMVSDLIDLFEGAPVISQPDNKPDNSAAKTCGDCSLLFADGFCKLRPDAYFYRGKDGRICTDFAGAPEKEVL